MDPSTLISYSLLLCAIGNIGVRSSEASQRSPDPTLPTIFATRILDTEDSETRHSDRFERVPNGLHDRSNEREDDVDGAPPDHAVPYSPHENPEEPPTKQRYTKPGDWAKPSPDSDIPLDFVPTKLYAQVRETHTVKRLPREEALKSAETAEEILAAPRLREVVSKSKSNTVYTEEGYEDAAYDHGGHVREADFHEGYASKLDAERSDKKGGKTGAKGSGEEDVKLEESDSAEELNDYGDEYRNYAEESSRIEQTSPKRRNDSDDYERLKSQLKNSDADPKQVTENGIEKLEKDLRREYEEAEKETENEVPENLKNTGNDQEESEEEEDDDDGETAGEDGGRNSDDHGRRLGSETGSEDGGRNSDDRGRRLGSETASEDAGKNSEDHGRRLGKKIDEPEASSRAMSVGASGESFESQNNEIRRVSSSSENNDDPPSQGSARFAESDGSERHAGELATTPDYGKLFWDYYKTDANIWKSHVTSAPNAVTSATNEADESVVESLTRVPSFPSVQTGIEGYDTFAFTPPSTAPSTSAFATRSGTDRQYPSATFLYESWKRRDRNPSNRESFEHDSFDSESNIHPIGFEGTEETGSDSALNPRHGQSATTLAGPKKLSYTIIIRPGDKSTTRSPPCDREDRSRPEEATLDDERTNPGYASVANQFEGEFGPETMHGFEAAGEDLTVIRPPLPVPLGQIAFADFPRDTYGSLVHPSVTQESGHWQLGQEINGERDGYRLTENPDGYRLQNHFGHASKLPRVRHNRGPPPGRKRNQYYPPLTKLVPPSPASRSKYAEYSGIRRNSKPRAGNDASSRVAIWPELLKFYRMIDGSIFGGRRRRSVDEATTKGTVSNSHEKVDDNVAALSGENHLRHERNLFREETNRLVAASPGGPEPRDANLRRGKSSKTGRRKRRSGEDSFDEAPRIAEEVINAEIKSRFEDEDDESSSADDDSSENDRAKIEVEVPDFNFTEVIDGDERREAMETRPREAETLNLEKYPFYADSEVSRSSALKYITNPRQVPRKTLGGTEFYDSRDRYLECAEVEPDLKRVTPEDEEPDADREPRGDQTRLRGLGDKLDCFRAKYFDEDPLDNPLFMEKNVGEPRVPEELDPAKFASRIIGMASNEEEERITRRVSRKPEVRDPRRSGSKVNQVARQADKSDRGRVNDDGSSGAGRSRFPENGERHRERGRGRRPTQATTESPELPVTPYQREVYEDVMGTIKNLAGMYQTFGESVQTPSIQPNVNHLSVVPEENDWAFPVVHITQRPRGFTIRGMLPPQPSEPRNHHRYRIIPYRTNKVSYGTRPRTKPLPGPEAAKAGYFKTVRVHKRSLDDDRVVDAYAEESRRIAVNSTRNTSQPAASEKTIYTIRDRIRHSRPRGEFGRNGKFTNIEAAGNEDVRRREPRYDRIRRKKVPSSTSEPATTSYREEIDAANSEKTTVSSLKKPAVSQGTPREDFLDEPGELYKIQYSTPQRFQARPGDARRRAEEPLSSEDDEKVLDEGATQETRNNNYDVHENVDEDVTPAPAIIELRKYLESDPPGYTETFDEESTEPPRRHAEEAEEPARNSRSGENDEEDEGRDEQVERPSESYVEEESSPDSEEADEKPDAPGRSESYRNSDDDDDAEEHEGEEGEKEDSPREDQSSRVEDGEKEFTRFASRPFSPFESNEDPKYSDLGPRVAKPAFRHPSFSEESSAKYRTEGSGERKRSGESDDDSSEEENGEKESRYVFPWDEDEAEGGDSEESRRSARPIGRYEYPWERRERLARERRRKRKEREKYGRLFRFSDSSEEDEEQDASHSELLRRRVYPWERHEVPTKSFRGAKASMSGKIVDSDEMGSENRPVRRFSSRYKSRRLRPNDDEDPIAASGADPKEIRVSMLKSMETALMEKDKSGGPDKILNATALATPKSSTDSLINRTTPSINSTTPSINSTTRSINSTTPSINSTTSSINHSTSSINRSTPSINRSTPSINRSTSSINHSTPSTNRSTPSINPTTPSINPTIPSRRSRNWKSRSISSPTSTTMLPTSTTGKPRIWRVASSATKKPPRSRSRTTTVASAELPKSERNDLNASASVSSTTIAPAIDRRSERNDLNASASVSSTTIAPAIDRRNVRRRGQSSDRSPGVTSVARRRSQTSTKAPDETEASTPKTATERTTTPIGKTIEHRSRFSKEEIITKTSYPRINLEDADNDENDKNNGRVDEEKDSAESDKSGKLPMNERVEKVSIVTKETPEHIYRKEEIDKDGVKGMFVSITPNNGTNSPPDSEIDAEDDEEMLGRFANSEDEVVQDAGEDIGGSFVQDSHLLANLLTQVRPYTNDLRLDENVQERNFSGEEGSGSVDAEDDADEAEHVFRSRNVKHPHDRLYYYVEKRKR